MNKYELALIVNAKIEDEARAEVVEKTKGYITRRNHYGSGRVGQEEIGLRDSEDERRILLFHQI